MIALSKFAVLGAVAVHAVQMDAMVVLRAHDAQMARAADMSVEQKFADIFARLQQLEARVNTQQTRIDNQWDTIKAQQQIIQANEIALLKKASEIALLKKDIQMQQQARKIMELEKAKPDSKAKDVHLQAQANACVRRKLSRIETLGSTCYAALKNQEAMSKNQAAQSNSIASTLQQHIKEVNDFFGRLRQLSVDFDEYTKIDYKQMTTAAAAEKNQWKRAELRLKKNLANKIFGYVARCDF